MTRTKRRMSAHEFDALRPLLSISQDRIEAARAVLVEDKKMELVGASYGWTRQSVNDAIGIVWRTREKYIEAQTISANAGAILPPGWELVTLIAPSRLVEKFRAEVAASTDTAPTPPPAPPPAPKARKSKAAAT